uniref:Shaggy-related protein kinase epsilon n=1 Tax=Rhizophora mucronata TaxID=61149 RepID=A0A2P2LMJ7_RHIMU
MKTYQNFCTAKITKFKLMCVWIHLPTTNKFLKQKVKYD